MEYKLFGDYITLQALLKNLGIISSGGAVKSYLANTEVLFNGQPETRRGKKIRLGDQVAIPASDILITVVEPSSKEKAEHLSQLAEKERVAALVKELNQKNKKTKQHKESKTAPKTKKAVRFPGT
ncbi:S4 domain-containing protein YaaA [Streptococcus caviae]|uniref:S4 domain-containing protein YaaA n=1 Tax=Streptococcus sp. 'caviae' TaxID=1915004 RepID=UPI00094BBAE9|nr:S4 domain-containing protein YaaA [Streptococcus sp. 'caviae']OLN82410.1 hypothetical protein BMI76_09355 [Streptococcus sp. 'caviae']